MTGNLWMVTKGRLRSGDSRPAQRYGRHKYAGATRARVNSLVARAVRDDWTVSHWLSARPLAEGVTAQHGLRQMEEDFIVGWNLRVSGWNRG